MKRPKAAPLELPQTAAAYEAIETADAHLLLRQIGSKSPEALAIIKRFLKKHWIDGWNAARALTPKGRKP